MSRAAATAACVVCFAIGPVRALGETALPYAGPFLEEIRSAFFQVESDVFVLERATVVGGMNFDS